MKANQKWTVGLTLGVWVLAALASLTWQNANENRLAAGQNGISVLQGAGKAAAQNAFDNIGRALKGNKFGLNRDDLVVASNPKGKGHYIYVKKTRFSNVERYFIWFENSGLVSSLNGPTISATPSLPFPRDMPSNFLSGTGHDPLGVTRYGVDHIFK